MGDKVFLDLVCTKTYLHSLVPSLAMSWEKLHSWEYYQDSPHREMKAIDLMDKFKPLYLLRDHHIRPLPEPIMTQIYVTK